MKIGIVTVYEPTTNMGSFLQAYAMQTTLKSLGHDVYIVQNVSTSKAIFKLVGKINPKREFFKRFQKAYYSIQDIKRMKLINKNSTKKLDLLLYGSDEIWNLDNPYFDNGLFWGKDESVPKISYAVSAGAVNEQNLYGNEDFVNSIRSFNKILVRDNKTQEIVKKICGIDSNIVCDPTMLIPLEKYVIKAEPIKEKYLLVYTYGIDGAMIENVKRYAKEHNLIIVSVCFWHIWADRIIECSALQFSDIIKNAECVFTTTFHGAVFTMLNHKKCCIFPVRPKVQHIVEQMGEEIHLIQENCKYENFKKIMNMDFDDKEFEKRLKIYREYSLTELKEAIKCLEK